MRFLSSFFFFFNDTATTEIYTLSLHDALPISAAVPAMMGAHARPHAAAGEAAACRSEEHTSELQSQSNLVCRLLLEKKKNKREDRENMTGRKLTIADIAHESL